VVPDDPKINPEFHFSPSVKAKRQMQAFFDADTFEKEAAQGHLTSLKEKSHRITKKEIQMFKNKKEEKKKRKLLASFGGGSII